MEKTWEENNHLTKAEGYEFKESSINRIMKHAKEDGIVIISACRSSLVDEGNPANDLTDEYLGWIRRNHRKTSKESEEIFLKERNNEEDNKLKLELHNPRFPYAHIPVYGGYKSAEGVADSNERSYIIINADRYHGDHLKRSWEDLYKRALDWCAKYKQNSVYIQPPNEDPFYADREGNIVGVGNKDNFDFNKNDSYYTTVRRQRTAPNFTADMTFTENLLRENYVRRSLPSSLFDCQRRSYFGEYNTFFDK